VNNVIHQPIFVSFLGRTGLLLVSSDFVEALAAVDRSAFTGFKRYFRILATLGANRGEHLACAVAAAAGTVSLGLPCLTAGRASLGFIGVAFGLEELLFLSSEGERSSTIGTLKLLVLKTQRMTSFLLLVG
jgi:hypothetical protein